MSDNYYKDLSLRDILTPVAPLVEAGNLKWSRTHPGKLELSGNHTVETPWIRVWVEEEDQVNCAFALSYLWPLYFSKMPQPIVPSFCHECWKVVVRPDTFKQLWAIYKRQQADGFRSKCGIETRPQVGGLYGAYWYNVSKEEGMEKYEYVKNLEETQGIKVILKKACSEYEWKCGDSSQWKIIGDQLEVEQRIKDMLVMDGFKPTGPPPQWFIDRIEIKWIEWAFSHGDKTVLEFTGGESPFTLPYRTYEE